MSLTITLLERHAHWMLWCAIVYLPLSQWGNRHARVRPVRETPRRRCLWALLGLGWYAACGYLGLLAVYGCPDRSVPWGVATLIVAAGLGIFPFIYPIPPLYGLGVVLLPMACGLSTWGTVLLRALGLTRGGA